MNATLRILSAAAFAVAATGAHAASFGQDAAYPASVAAPASAASSAAGAAMSAANPAAATASPFVWNGNELGLTIDTSRRPVASARPATAAPRDNGIFLGA